MTNLCAATTRVKPGNDEKLVHGGFVEAVNPRKNP
jgi:hypothetical protein